MDIQHLKYFVEIAKNKSYTRAAEQLFITQPMLTRVIKQMEDDLNVKLIERTSKSFRLTDVGVIFYRQAQEILQRYNDLFRTVEDVKSAKIGEVRLSTPGVLLDVYFPPLLAEFHEKYPGIDMSIVEEGSKLVARSIVTDNADLGMVMLPISCSYQFGTNIVVSNVCQLLVSKSHPFAQRQSVHIGELKDERILTFSETATLHDTLIELCEEHGFLPHLAYKSLMPGFSFRMVSMQQCIAVLPVPIIQQYITDDLVMVPLEPEIKWDIAVIYKKDRYHSYAATRFLEFLCDYYSRLQGGPPHVELKLS